jgi:hypothetical protein
MTFDMRKSLQELENSDWGDPKFDSSLVVRCHELRRLPICQMNAEDCRLLLGQNIGERYIVPRALEVLADDPLAGGDMLPGALLRNVLELAPEFWSQFPELWWQLKEIVFEIQTIHEEIENRILPRLKGLSL